MQNIFLAGLSCDVSDHSDFNYVQQSNYLALNTHIAYIYVHTYIYIDKYTILLIKYTTKLINNATGIGV